MKIKKTFGLLAAVAVVAAAGWSYQQSKQYDGMSELALANVEALATGETDWALCSFYGCIVCWDYTCTVYSSTWGTIKQICPDMRG